MSGGRPKGSAPVVAADAFANTWNADVERAVLGVALDGRHADAWGRVCERCDGARAFYVREHRLIALVIERLYSDGARIDALSVADAAGRVLYADAIEQLRVLDGEKRGVVRIDQGVSYADSLVAGIGGHSFIGDIGSAFAPASGLEANATILDQHHRRRRMLSSLIDATAQIRAATGIDKAAQIADELTSKLGDTFGRGRVAQTLVDGVDEVLVAHDEAKARGAGIVTGSWGLPALDAKMPLEAGQMTTLAGDTGGGKTSLTLEAIMATARKLGRGSVAVVNLEQDNQELAGILVAREIGVPKSTLKGGWLTAEQRQAGDAIRAEIDRLGVYVRDNAGSSTISDIAGWIRQRKRRSSNLHLVVVDHIGLIDAASSRDREYDTLTAASKALKRLTMIGLHVIVVAQFNTEGQKRVANAEPKLTDLHGSGSMRKDSDNVLLLWRRSQDKSPTRQVDLIGAKCRGQGEFTIGATFFAADGQRFTVRKPTLDPERKPDAAARAVKFQREPIASEDLFGGIA